MNYYEHHIGDFAEATAHLSFVEDAAYSRLIRKYYAQEKPLPIELSKVQRLVGARTKEEKKAVEDVLSEFFFQTEEGWRNSRCDEEIAKFHAKQPKAQEKKENDRERQQRARERRKSLFEELSSLGVNMTWNATTEALQDELLRIKSQTGHAPVTEPVTRDNTATQTPDTSHHTPVLNKHTVDEVHTIVPIVAANPHQPAPDFENLPANVHPLTVKFKMHSEWEPGESFETLARVAGLVFGDKLPAKELGEFKTYWLTHAHQPMDQNQWEHKFIQNLLFQKARASK